jgi:hypothetical protein
MVVAPMLALEGYSCYPKQQKLPQNVPHHPDQLQLLHIYEHGRR